MNIYNLFFDKTERETNPNAGWSVINTHKGLKLTASVEGHVKTVVGSSLTTEVDHKDLCIVPSYKNAKLELKNGDDTNVNFALYVKVAEGQMISSIKLDGCSVVMSNIPDSRKEAALIIIVQDPDNYNVRIYQTDKQVISIQKNKYKLSKISHELNMSKAIRPRMYLQLPIKAYFTTNVRSAYALDLITAGYKIVYTPLFLVGNKHLDTSFIRSSALPNAVINANNDYIIDGKDKEKYGNAVEDILKGIHVHLNISTTVEEYTIERGRGTHCKITNKINS